MFIIKNPALAEMECWLDGVIERLDDVIADPEHTGKKEVIAEVRALTADLERLLIRQEPAPKTTLH